eukprot:Gregarina_sp_Poly_1__2099@NODE_1554_length_3855_cov_59_429514_g1026_i0_p2_GENE_NODE_1554_length_3855_cov_59_429514_g1026_i0NODE_1554_length_3855_cov_59_429514_g1026_i0_p2_ORF_typecomplete_len128_score3_70_NODE_1554_length_3855_cov_59_429514_g1026_i06471030
MEAVCLRMACFEVAQNAVSNDDLVLCVLGGSRSLVTQDLRLTSSEVQNTCCCGLVCSMSSTKHRQSSTVSMQIEGRRCSLGLMRRVLGPARCSLPIKALLSDRAQLAIAGCVFVCASCNVCNTETPA